VSEAIKSVSQRVSARFKNTVETLAKKKNRTFVGQADHCLDVYLLVTELFRHDELDTLREDLDAVRTETKLRLVAEAKAAYNAKVKP